MKKLFIILILLIFVAGCTNRNVPVNEVENYISQAKQKFAPDKRTALFDITALLDNGKMNLSGETNLPKAKAWLLKNLKEKNIEVIDNIEILPSKDLGDSTYAFIHNSVANLRTIPHDYGEMATQALMGTPLRVLERNKKGDWYRVQTPDNYIAWIEHSYITRITKDNLNEWKKSNKVIYNNVYGFAYSKPDKKSDIFSDLVEGDIFHVLSKEGRFYKAKYPDGRIAYVPTDECRNYGDWLNDTTITFKRLFSTAKMFTGIPYLWGGTSPKAFDCSGFTKTVYFLHGILLARDASQQVNTGEPVNAQNGFDNMKPGDLLFFGRKATGSTKEHITHVGMYIGNEEFINSAAHYAGRVLITSLDKSSPLFNQYRYDTFIRAKRILTSVGKNGIERIRDDSLYNRIPLR